MTLQSKAELKAQYAQWEACEPSNARLDINLNEKVEPGGEMEASDIRSAKLRTNLCTKVDSRGDAEACGLCDKSLVPSLAPMRSVVEACGL